MQSLPDDLGSSNANVVLHWPIPILDQRFGANLKKLFFAKFYNKFVSFFAFFKAFYHKKAENAQHPNAGQNIQHLCTFSCVGSSGKNGQNTPHRGFGTILKS